MPDVSEQGLRERKKQRTHRAISDAAIRLFLESGFDKVSVAEIAAAAEVSKPTLFKYFPTKEDLVLHRFADHSEEAATVVRERPARQPPLGALRGHFVAGLRARDPITGLSDDPEVLAFSRLLYGTPSLVARLSQFTDRSTLALADALREATGTGPEDLTALLAAGQIITVQRLLALENYRRIASGQSSDERYPAAIADANRAFALLRSGLGSFCG
ncbi:TetR/AcrR family transcriptional regulator [Amycolatopsis anabasis]|uniref:TetR/AcrR family transcriptional regulator n=1 Tax=Amycolatopsis anabasis TaxID=1840409 RepID=UPI00131CB5F4|nr:TetR family transcriptional regulator [Amycolatopsis anabasis]